MKWSRQPPPEVRFWRNVTIGGIDQCWLWKKSLYPNGYGKWKIKGNRTSAHRTAFLYSRGQLPKGVCVCHRCDVKLCCNPTHLFTGTYKDNMDDAFKKGRMYMGTRQWNSKLTPEKVRQIRELDKKGVSNKILAKHFLVTESNVEKILAGTAWRHIT